MRSTLHITNGDVAAECLQESTLTGDVLGWRDILYDGLRKPGWPDEQTMRAKAVFLSEMTGGGVTEEDALQTLQSQYHKLNETCPAARIILWFDACLYDQSMLAHLLNCLDHLNCRMVEILCIADFPGIEPFNGLGQLNSSQLSSCYPKRIKAVEEHFHFARYVDMAFANQDMGILETISNMLEAPLPWVPAAAKRWLEEQPDSKTGLGKLEYLVLDALKHGLQKPAEIFHHVAAADTPPQYWGDISLWAVINGLADRSPPLLQINGPAKRLPQWNQIEKIKQFRIKSL